MCMKTLQGFLLPHLRMHTIPNQFDPEGKKHAFEKAMPFPLNGKRTTMNRKRQQKQKKLL